MWRQQHIIFKTSTNVTLFSWFTPDACSYMFLYYAEKRATVFITAPNALASWQPIFMAQRPEKETTNDMNDRDLDTRSGELEYLLTGRNWPSRFFKAMVYAQMLYKHTVPYETI